MKKIQLTLLSIIALFGLTMAQVHANDSAGPKAVGLIFHAEWCGSCKEMDPKIKEARQDLGHQQSLNRSASISMRSIGPGLLFQ